MSDERIAFGDVTMIIKASAADTDGAFMLFEEVPPLVDTPPHVHAHEDELYYVLEGEHVFRRGDDELTVGPGDTIFLPRGVPHGHRRVVPHVGRLLGMAAPGGLEGFFRQLSDAHAAGTLGPDTYADASERYGISWVR